MRRSTVKEAGSNVKVVCRFRPLINIELELAGEFKEIYSFPTDQSVKTEENDTFTYDRVFPMNTSQNEMFEFIGKPIIDDVLIGYNGTVLAYGQTGSGKSFSMMGLDIYNPDSMGIIPRAIKLIFESVEKASSEAEITLKCSMLEIYKEKLKDLCGCSPELKIKENKTKGIFVDGLTEIYVASEEEMLEVLSMGERNRTVASTKMNSVSSRSHQLFILEVKAKLPNDSERRGILNLVDLAGSEKINQTGVTGNKLEEAKKINLSLSALGNVINSLIKNSEHVPYRDSKLTRLLQESLGGNYKTTLIVCCSPHPRNYDDTINTLKFAQRAKTIKNKVHLNIKKSAEEYMKIIEDLKRQLNEAHEQIEHWKGKVSRDNGHKRRYSVKELEIRGFIPEVTAEDPDEYKSDSSCSSEQVHKSEEKNLEELKNLKNELEDSRGKIQEINENLAKETSKRINAEKKYLECFENYNKMLLSVNEKNNTQEYMLEENMSLYNQIEALKNHVKIMHNKYNEVICKVKSGENITEWEFSDYPEDPGPIPIHTHDNPIVINDQKPESLIGISVDPGKLIQQDLYAQELTLALEESSALNLQIIVFELKKQIINSGLVNCELFRNYSDLKLRETLLSEKFNLKVRQLKFQANKLKLYENIIQSLQASYSKVVRVLESGEFDRGNLQDLQKKAKIIRPIKVQSSESFEGGLRRMNTSLLASNYSSSLRRQSTSVAPEKMNFKIGLLDSSYSVQMMYNQQLKQEIELVVAEKNSYKNLYSQFQGESYKMFEKEKGRWKGFLDKFKGNCDKELMRRQNEINQLNLQIAHWMSMYVELQQASDRKTLQKVLNSNRSSRLIGGLNDEQVVKMSLADSPLHTEMKQGKLSVLVSKRGDDSPPAYEEN